MYYDSPHLHQDGCEALIWEVPFREDSGYHGGSGIFGSSKAEPWL